MSTTPEIETQIEALDHTDVSTNVAWFRGFLSARDVVPAPGSALAKILERTDDYGRTVTGAGQMSRSRADARDFLRDAIPGDFIIRAMHMAGPNLHAHFDWRMFSSKDVLLTRSAERSQDRDLIFELLVAAMCATFCTDVSIGGPDVLATFRGVRYGIACKIFYSEDGAVHEDAFIKGARQINAASEVQRGYVLANLANLLPHEDFFPAQGPGLSVNEVKGKVDNWVRDFHDRLSDKGPFLDRLHKRQDEGGLKLRGLLTITPMLADVAGKPATFLWMQSCPLFFMDPTDDAFERALHAGFQKALRHRIPMEP